jgi:Yip1-like protein
MGLVDRVKNILVTPKTEWDVIAAETTPPKDLVLRYVLPLAGLAALVGFINTSIIGYTLPLIGGTYRTPIGWGLTQAVLGLAMTVVMIFVLAFLIDALAPKFGAQKNMAQAIKVAVYACTAAWVGSVLVIVPVLGPVLALIGVIYTLYLLYLGLPRLMKSPEDKSLAYTGVVIACAILLGVAIHILGRLITPGMGPMGGYGAGAAASVTYEKDSKMARLDEFAKKVEAAGKKMEAGERVSL